MEDGSGRVLHLNVDKTGVFWLKEDPRSRLAGIFSSNIARPLHGVKLLGGSASVDFDFCNELVMKRVAKTIGLMDAIAKINDPQCELLLLRSCTGISMLYFTMRTCPPCVFESSQRSFDVALRSSLERISAGLQTKLLRHTGIVSPGSILDDALSVFNTSMETDLLSNPSEIVAPKLMKKMADIYFTRVTKNEESTFSLSPRQIALWTSQREDHTFDWLRTVPISGLGQTMNGKTYRCVLCYGLGIPLFSVSKPCSACSRVFAGDIYGDHTVSCAGIIGIKHRHNVVRDTLVDICYRSGISAGNEVDIGLDGGCDKPLRPANMLLYSWDGGLDVGVDLTVSSPLTQTGMVDFVPGRAVIDVAQRKRGKYMANVQLLDMGFFPFSFSSFGELEADVVTLLKRIRKFFMAQDIEERVAIHIFNRISFAIAKGVGPHIVSRLPSNLLLPTRVNLSRRGVLLDSHLCPLCNAAMEDVQHVFFRCDVARVVLRKICRWWDLDWQEICSFSDWDAWFLSFRLSSRLKSILEGVFYVAWWRIWRLRNQLVFDASPPNRSTIFDDIVSWSFLWCSSRCNRVFSWEYWLKNPYLISL
ncbi:ankyrin repeat-containing protein ITN1-like protein [Tanacetum coccineum]